jgi:membrane-associated phospholipid phosphatase
MIDRFDVSFSQWISSLSGRFPTLDFFVGHVLNLDSVKHLPLVGVLVWAWFSDIGDGVRRRRVFDGVAGYVLSLIASQGIQLMMPRRPRPALSGSFDFHRPSSSFVNDWSSFPSDGAAQGFALVTAIWLLSPWLGVAAGVWASFAICFPRLYGGAHYPSDIVAGIFVGVAATLIVARLPLNRDRIEGRLIDLESKHKAWFYLFGFVVFFEMMLHFEDVRQLLGASRTMAKLMLTA